MTFTTILGPWTTHDEHGVRLYRVTEVAEQLACSVSTVRRLIRLKRLPIVRILNLVRVSEPALQAFIAARPKR